MNVSEGVQVSVATTTTVSTIVSFLGNALIIFIVAFNKGMRNCSNAYILNISACYGVVAMLQMPACLISTLAGNRVFSRPFCSLLSFANDLVFTETPLSITCFVLHQYLVVRTPAPALARHCDTHRNTLLLIASSWLLSAVCSCVSNLSNHSCDIYTRYPSFFVSWLLFIGFLVLCSFTSLILFALIFVEMNNRRLDLDRCATRCEVSEDNLARFSHNVTTTLIIFVTCFLTSTPLSFYRVFSGRKIIAYNSTTSLFLVQVYFTQATVFPAVIVFRARAFMDGFRQLFCSISQDALTEELKDQSPYFLRRGVQLPQYLDARKSADDKSMRSLVPSQANGQALKSSLKCSASNVTVNRPRSSTVRLQDASSTKGGSSAELNESKSTLLNGSIRPNSHETFKTVVSRSSSDETLDRTSGTFRKSLIEVLESSSGDQETAILDSFCPDISDKLDSKETYL